MSSTFQKLIHTLDESDQEEFLVVAEVGLSLYRAYASLLQIHSFRASIATVYEPVGGLLDAIYTKHLFSRESLMRRVEQKKQQSSQISFQSKLPDRVCSDLAQGGFNGSFVAERSDIVGLFARGQGKIYKRSLEKDVEKLLK